MGNATSPIPTEALKSAADILEEKANSLIAERTRLRLRIVREAAKDLQLSRDINGCVSGATALGYTLELVGIPPLGKPAPAEVTSFLTARNALFPLVAYFEKQVQPELTDQLLPDDPVVPKASPPPMPKVADVVLERLRLAGQKGCKAAEIRNFILQTYHQEVHEKTVGMTLFRLKNAQKVRRDGHDWFLAS